MSSRRTQSCIAASPDRVARGDVEKASAFGFSFIRNHPFVDGNKRIGHAALAFAAELAHERVVPIPA